jgi:hypothetical protein
MNKLSDLILQSCFNEEQRKQIINKYNYEKICSHEANTELPTRERL